MKIPSIRFVLAPLASAAMLAGGCNALIGTRDLFLSDAGTSSGGPTDATIDANGSDAANRNDAPQCVEGSPSLQTDKANCGRCGHSCLGGECKAGVCEAVRISNEGKVIGIALDGDDIYFTSSASNAVYRAKKDGSAVQLIANSQEPAGVAVGSASVVWSTFDFESNGGGVYRCPKTGCVGAPVRVSGGARVPDVALTGDRSGNTFVYPQFNGAQVTLWDGTAAVKLDDLGTPFKVAVDDTYVYTKSQSNSLYRARLSGVGPSEIVGPAGGTAINGGVAVRKGRVFWTAGDLGTTPGRVRSAETADVSKQATYFNEGVLPWCITADDTHVYWGTYGVEGTITGAVYACPIAGCTKATTIVQNVDRVEDVEVDDNAIYIGLFSGGILRIAKP